MVFNRHLSSPLAFDAGIGGYLAVASVQQRPEAVDLALVVDVDLEGELGTVTPVGPGNGSDGACEAQEVLGSDGGGVARVERGLVEESGEEEGDGDEG